jgi:hypothetical protein
MSLSDDIIYLYKKCHPLSDSEENDIDAVKDRAIEECLKLENDSKFWREFELRCNELRKGLS